MFCGIDDYDDDDDEIKRNRIIGSYQGDVMRLCSESQIWGFFLHSENKMSKTSST